MLCYVGLLRTIVERSRRIRSDDEIGLWDGLIGVFNVSEGDEGRETVGLVLSSGIQVIKDKWGLRKGVGDPAIGLCFKERRT